MMLKHQQGSTINVLYLIYLYFVHKLIFNIEFYIQK